MTSQNPPPKRAEAAILRHIRIAQRRVSTLYIQHKSVRNSHFPRKPGFPSGAASKFSVTPKTTHPENRFQTENMPSVSVNTVFPQKMTFGYPPLPSCVVPAWFPHAGSTSAGSAGILRQRSKRTRGVGMRASCGESIRHHASARSFTFRSFRFF